MSNYPLGMGNYAHDPRSPDYEPAMCVECRFEDDLNEDGICADCLENDEDE